MQDLDDCKAHCARGCIHYGKEDQSSLCPHYASAQEAMDYIANTSYDEIMATAKKYTDERGVAFLKAFEDLFAAEAQLWGTSMADALIAERRLEAEEDTAP